MAKENGNKEIHRLTLLEYLSNPDNEFLNRAGLATTALGFSSPCVLYHIFTPEELTEIEAEALEMRRTMYGAKLARVDQAVLRRAASDDGTAADAKLAYQRFEGWSEKQIRELVLDGPFLAQMFQIFPPEIAEQVKAALVARHKELT
jgi:hypothetical protein